MGSTTATRVRAKIADLGVSQHTFARMVDLEGSKLSKSLSGTRRFTADELMRIARACGTTIDWLVTGRDGAGVRVPALESEGGHAR